MNAGECGQILALMATYDYRDVDDVVVAAWLKVVGDLSYPDAERAVTEHYRESRERMMPADVRSRVKAVRAARLQDARLEGRPPADAAGYQEWLRAERKRIADGVSAPRAIGSAQ